jgi:hypothetical protein
MGWTYSSGWPSPFELKRDQRAQMTECDILGEASTAYGRRWWLALQSKKTGEKFILLMLLDRQPGYGWGYKDIEESMGPVEYDCPVKLLDLVGELPSVEHCLVTRADGTQYDPFQYARPWRAEVRRQAALRKTPVKCGDKVWLTHSRVSPFTISEIRGRTLLGYGTDGVRYRVPRARIARVETSSTTTS